MDVLQVHLDHWKATSFHWGGSDCMLAIAAYLQDVHGADCAADYRGKYSDRVTCQAVTGFETDPLGLFEKCVSKLNLEITSTPARGDVALIETGGIKTGAICLGAGMWAIRALRGVMIVKNTKILKAWKA